MSRSHVNRRELGLAAAAVGIGLLPAPAAVAAGAAADGPKSFGKRHLDLVNTGVKTLASHQAGSEKGVHLLLERLRQQKAVTKEEAELLHAVVDKLVADLAAARRFLDEQLEKIEEAGHEVVTAIASIVSKSILWCLEAAKGLTPQQKTRIVLKDFSGAIQGAIAGMGLAAIAAFAGVPVPLLAAGCALAGSAASSLDAASDALNPEKK